jgi:hypothetical protein
MTHTFTLLFINFLITFVKTFKNSNTSNNSSYVNNSNIVKIEKSSNAIPNRYNYPTTNRSMNDLKIFLNLIKKNIPFGFSHFNDGMKLVYLFLASFIRVKIIYLLCRSL